MAKGLTRAPTRQSFRDTHRLALVGGVGGSEPRSKPDLLETIESQIIPRLVLAHCAETQNQPVCSEARLPPNEIEVEEFARIAACEDLPSALAYVEQLCRQGLSLESVLLDLLAPAARLLGEQWQSDLRTFTEVTVGLGVLQQVVHVLGPSFAPTLPHRGLVVLVAAAAEQHTLGLYLVGEFLRRAGWGVQVTPNLGETDLVDQVANEPVEAVGISVSNPDLLKAVARTITALRKATCNPGMTILLGGPIDLTEFAALHGAQVCSADPQDAVRSLEQHARRSKAIS